MALVDIVDISSHSDNIFFNIYSDLLASITTIRLPINILLSYAYLRRFAAAGLFTQGKLSKEEFLESTSILEIFLQDVPQSQYDSVIKNYKNEAIDFVKIYDRRLTVDIIDCVIVMADTIIKSIPDYKPIKKNASYEQVIQSTFLLKTNSGKKNFYYVQKNIFFIFVFVFVIILLIFLAYNIDIFNNNKITDLNKILEMLND